MTKQRISFYNDLNIFGGHAIMTAKIANVLAASSDYAVSFIFHHPYFAGILSEKVNKIKIPFRTMLPLPGIRSFNKRQIKHIASLIQDIKPALFVVSQGNIEFGLKGLFAARAAKVKIVSYMPWGYSFGETNSRLHAIRDRINSRYYRIPAAYITLNEYQKGLLTRFIAGPQKVYTIRSPIEYVADSGRDLEKKDAAGSAYNLAVIARINFRQKNHNILIETARLLKKERFNFKFYIIGDGPDKKKLVRSIMRKNLKEYFIFTGWLGQDDLRQLLSQNIDSVLIVSHYEGVPLVLLEAAGMNIPFLMSDLDSIREYNFPSAFLVNPRDPEDIKNKIAALRKNFNSQEYLSVRKALLTHHHIERFKSDVMRTFADLTA